MSTKTVRKLAIDPEREERWLNEMSAAGWHLARYTFCTYRFEQGAPSEWTYRIQLLGDLARTPKSREYLALVEATGAEVVDTYGRWVYLRRRTAEGPFELFSDLDSRIAYYRRLVAFYGAMTAVLAVIMASPVTRTIESAEERIGDFWGLAIFVPYLALVTVFFTQTLRWARRLRDLQARRTIEE